MLAARAARAALPLAERVARKVVKDPSGCWLWTGALSLKRRGRRPVIQVGGRGTRVISVARWTCEQKNGPPPTPEHEAGHTCPGGERDDCVNPDHLTWMTRVENELFKRGRYRREDSDFS
jgi:hypothetical protein